jgi:hypothetical protein
LRLRSTVLRGPLPGLVALRTVMIDVTISNFQIAHFIETDQEEHDHHE